MDTVSITRWCNWRIHSLPLGRGILGVHHLVLTQSCPGKLTFYYCFKKMHSFL